MKKQKEILTNERIIDTCQTQYRELRQENKELKRKNKNLKIFLLLSIIIGGFVCGFYIAENSNGNRAIDIILNNPDIPKEIKNKFKNS